MLDCREVRTDFNCESCFEITFEECADIIISAQLTPITDYYLQLFDQFDISRTIAFTTDINGDFEIDPILLPDNYFNPFGNYDFYVSDDEEGLNTIPLTFNATEYLCVILIINKAI